MGQQGRKLCSETGSRGEWGTVCRILIHSNTGRCSYTCTVWSRSHSRVQHTTVQCKSNLATDMAVHCVEQAASQLALARARKQAQECMAGMTGCAGAASCVSGPA